MRPKRSSASARQRDPLTIQAARLEAEAIEEIQAAVNLRIEQAYQAALADPYPDIGAQVADAR